MLLLLLMPLPMPVLLPSPPPPRPQAGLAAPLLLVAIRMLQGFAVGGEFTSTMVFLVEHAPPHSRGLHGSWAFASVMVRAGSRALGWDGMGWDVLAEDKGGKRRAAGAKQEQQAAQGWSGRGFHEGCTM